MKKSLIESNDLTKPVETISKLSFDMHSRLEAINITSTPVRWL